MLQLRVYTVLCIITAIVLSACSGDSGRKLHVHTALLGPQVTHNDAGFSFSPPVGWLAVEGPFLNKYLKNNETDEASRRGFRFMPVFLFNDPDKNSALLITVIEPVSNETASGLADAYKTYVTNSLHRFNLKRDEWTHKGILMTHFIISKDGLFTSRVLFTAGSGKVIQFDFTFPSAGDAENAVSLFESVVGSIKVV